MSFANAIWYPNSRATNHVTNDNENIQEINPWNSEKRVVITYGNYIPISRSRQSSFPLNSNNLHHKNILHVPCIKKNLLSIKKLCLDNNAYVLFDSSSVYIKDRSTDKEIMRGVNDGLYQVELEDCPVAEINLGEKTSLTIWYHRLGHVSVNKTKESINLFHLPISSKSMNK